MIPIAHPEDEVLRTRYEKGAGLMHSVQPGEVQVTAFHDVEGVGLDGQNVQHSDVPHCKK